MWLPCCYQHSAQWPLQRRQTKRNPVPSWEWKVFSSYGHKTKSDCSTQDGFMLISRQGHSSSTNRILDWSTVSTRQLILVVHSDNANEHTTKNNDNVTAVMTPRNISNKTCSTINHIHRFHLLNPTLRYSYTKLGAVQNLTTHGQQLRLCSLHEMNVVEPNYTSHDIWN
jgi:hypothetical protein